jgi:hypothetical protein
MDNNALQKLGEAARLIKDTACQLKEAGLELDFEIKIKAQRPTFIMTGMTDPGENVPPPK